MSDIAPDAPEMVDVADLTFDLKNPRLVEFDMTGHSGERDIVRTLWETMDVRELVMSIAASGFFRHEPVVVCREDNRNVVIEGNRRLAAVKLIRDAALAQEVGATIPHLPGEAREALSQIPVVFDTREHAWRYLGFKHVNGPAKWNSYAKSRYIADVHRQFGVELADIASQIGDTHQTVQRMFRGLMVIEQAERLRVFDRQDRWRNHFAFSHLYTGLGYSHISDFIGLRPETEERMDPVPETKEEELGELCLWIYGSRRRETPPLVERQNPHLRQLDVVLGNREGTATLRGGCKLDVAFEASRPSSTVFEESLQASKRHLQSAHGQFSTGYDGSGALLRMANDVANLADDLCVQMERKRDPGRRRRGTTAIDVQVARDPVSPCLGE